ncbi:uncharacterized protein LOC126369730 [Pectinophora gossypiella]|uniref:uncharacterized protein LOC126369730 n=1 Tax=Pectinophora gossypiella TaxID=13191 RepID=UPI00214F13B3|nr:uncharacterized protein LOC126369730 [Pectinophora gossypiella]
MGRVRIGSERLQSVLNLQKQKRFFSSPRVRSRLRIDAYPTLFSADEITTDIGAYSLHHDADGTKNVSHEHNFCKRRLHENHSYSKVEVPEKSSDAHIYSTPRRPRRRRRVIVTKKSDINLCKNLL